MFCIIHDWKERTTIETIIRTYRNYLGAEKIREEPSQVVIKTCKKCGKQKAELRFKDGDKKPIAVSYEV
jgi:hypothetical protein